MPLIGRQGVRLSGGKRQRLTIARMILGKPQVVILDEVTSALREFFKDRTRRIIAHRLRSETGRPGLFDDGRIIEEGAHEELIRNDGLYSRLYRRLQH